MYGLTLHAQEFVAESFQSQRDAYEIAGYNKGLQKKANRGDSDAQYSLGVHYLKGVSRDDWWDPDFYDTYDLILDPNPQKAFEWFTKSAEQGNKWAQYQLAGMLSSGYYKNGFYEAEEGEQRIGKDFKMAIYWYRKAIEQNHMDACYALAKIFRMNEGALSDIGMTTDLAADSALYYHFLSAELGHPIAQYTLGELLLKKGQKFSPETLRMEYPKKDEAIKWFNKSAGFEGVYAEDALLLLGVNYYYGHDSNQPLFPIDLEIEKDYDKAFFYFEQLARSERSDDGFGDGYYYLGLCYLKGFGTEKKLSKARKLIKKAYLNGHQEATEAWNNKVALGL
jgi:TPR repeat protein